MKKRSEVEIHIPGVSRHTKVSELTVQQFVQLLVQTSDSLRAARSTPNPEELKKMIETIRNFNTAVARDTEEDIYKQLPELVRKMSKDFRERL
jgi:hypothetical protein